MIETDNILHSASSLSKRVCKSVLVAELFALMEGYNAGYLISRTVSEIIGRKIDLTLYTDSCSINGLCIAIANTNEGRFTNSSSSHPTGI